MQIFNEVKELATTQKLHFCFWVTRRYLFLLRFNGVFENENIFVLGYKFYFV